MADDLVVVSIVAFRELEAQLAHCEEDGEQLVKLLNEKVAQLAAMTADLKHSEKMSLRCSDDNVALSRLRNKAEAELAAMTAERDVAREKLKDWPHAYFRREAELEAQLTAMTEERDRLKRKLGHPALECDRNLAKELDEAHDKLTASEAARGKMRNVLHHIAGAKHSDACVHDLIRIADAGLLAEPRKAGES